LNIPDGKSDSPNGKFRRGKEGKGVVVVDGF